MYAVQFFMAAVSTLSNERWEPGVEAGDKAEGSHGRERERGQGREGEERTGERRPGTHRPVLRRALHALNRTDFITVRPDMGHHVTLPHHRGRNHVTGRYGAVLHPDGVAAVTASLAARAARPSSMGQFIEGEPLTLR